MLTFSLEKATHSLMVAKVMRQKVRELGLPDAFANDMFVLGYIHNIGYQLTTTPKCHNHVAGDYLKEHGYSYWSAVYYHGDPKPEVNSFALWLLNYGIMHVNSFGKKVSMYERLVDIESRYGADSEVYKNAYGVAVKVNDMFRLGEEV